MEQEKRSTFKLLFYLKKNELKKNGNAPIMARITIDGTAKSVWNGSRLAKELSANTFNEYWNKNIKPDHKELVEAPTKLSLSNEMEFPTEEPHHLFDFLSSDKYQDGLIEAFVGLLIPEAQDEDYEEQAFANRMRKKRKHKRGQ